MLCKVEAISLERSDGNYKNLVCAIAMNGTVVVWEHEFSPDDTTAATATNKYAKYTFNCPGAAGTSLALRCYNHDEYHVAVGCRDGSIQIRAITSSLSEKLPQPGTLVETIDVVAGSSASTTSCIMSLAWSLCGLYLAAGRKDGFVDCYKRECESRSGKYSNYYFKMLHRIVASRSVVRGLDFTADSQLLMTGDDNGRISVYDIQRKQAVKTRWYHGQHNNSWILCLVSHPDSRRFITAGADMKINVWDVSMRDCVHTFDGSHSDMVWGVACNKEGTFLASCGDDGKMVFYSSDEK